MNRKQVFSRIRILNYHAILADGQTEIPPRWSPYHALPVRAFSDQLDLLVRTGWQVVPLKALDQVSLPRKSVTLTFDDGACSDLVAAQELTRRSMLASFFVTWTRVGSPSFLQPEEVAELSRQGFTIGSHAMTHSHLTEMQPQALRDELVGSKQRLEDLIGKPVTALAVPFGAYNTSVLAAAIAAGYRRILTSDFRLADPAKCVLSRLTITPHLTLSEFGSLLDRNQVGIVSRRVVNGFRRRLYRLRAMAARP